MYIQKILSSEINISDHQMEMDPTILNKSRLAIGRFIGDVGNPETAVLYKECIYKGRTFRIAITDDLDVENILILEGV